MRLSWIHYSTERYSWSLKLFISCFYYITAFRSNPCSCKEENERWFKADVYIGINIALYLILILKNTELKKKRLQENCRKQSLDCSSSVSNVYSGSSALTSVGFGEETTTGNVQSKRETQICKQLFLFVNAFRYHRNNFQKNVCSLSR